MPNWSPIISQVSPPASPLLPGPLEPPRQFADRGTIILLSCLLALAAVVFLWAFFVRKRPKGARGTLIIDANRHRSSQAHGSSGRRRRRKRKDNHPENLGRNPTLSETGGLPPPRPEGTEPPPSTEPSRSA
jgi:hypothetical protein